MRGEIGKIHSSCISEFESQVLLRLLSRLNTSVCQFIHLKGMNSAKMKYDKLSKYKLTGQRSIFILFYFFLFITLHLIFHVRNVVTFDNYFFIIIIVVYYTLNMCTHTPNLTFARNKIEFYFLSKVKFKSITYYIILSLPTSSFFFLNIRFVYQI